MDKDTCLLVVAVKAGAHPLHTGAPDAMKLITGDFNHCNLKQTIPRSEQYVTCAVRAARTLDLFCSNVHSAYRSVPLPPLGCSDHSLVQVLPCRYGVVPKGLLTFLGSLY